MVHSYSRRQLTASLAAIVVAALLALLVPIDQPIAIMIAILIPIFLVIGFFPRTAAAQARPYVTPRQLPAPPARLIGREQEFSALSALAASQAEPKVINLYGPTGIGKTALAIAFAHDASTNFSDGQLFAYLAATASPPGEPDPLRSILADFVYALQPQDSPVPDDIADLRALYAKLTEGRKLLIVLDDVPDTLRFNLLLPDRSHQYLMLMTSRGVRGDIQVDQQLKLGPLSEDASTRLLASITHSDDLHILRPLARSCSRQPLALKLAGSALSHRPHRELAVALHRAMNVKVHPHGAEPLSAVYGFLTQDERSAFKSLSVIGAQMFSPSAFAAAAGVDEAMARRLADRLVDAMLLERYDREPFAESRYAAQDLVRSYAEVRAQAEDSSDVQIARAARMTAERARLAETTDPGAVRSRIFLLEERGDLAGALDLARGLLSIASQRSDMESECMARAAIAELSAELGNVHESKAMAMRAAAADDLSTRARAYRCLGHARRRLLESRTAHADLECALEMAQSCGDSAEQVRILNELAVTAVLATHDYASALKYGRLAERICGEAKPGVPSQLSATLTAQGRALIYAGRHSEAARVLRLAQDLALQNAQPLRRAYAAYWASEAALASRQLAEARSLIGPAVDQFASMQHYYGLARCRKTLGDIALLDGKTADAADFLQQALDTFHSCGDPAVEAEALAALAAAFRELGRSADAKRLDRSASAIRALLRPERANAVPPGGPQDSGMPRRVLPWGSSRRPAR